MTQPHGRHLVIEGVRYGLTPIGAVDGRYTRAILAHCPSVPPRVRPDGCQAHGCCEHGVDYCPGGFCEACEAMLDDSREWTRCVFGIATDRG